ncbi:MAG: NADH-quinone oxidoreductase subunit J [Gammaproteobacteria bacterium]|nr:NADH-quinone oxidoreductase subunit J [Gammaproteobacteria bacterium]
MITFAFYMFAVILLIAAFRVITVRNPVHAALFLVLAFFSSAALWMLLEAEFLAITLVLVYVGAVMVLFLFVIMMLDVDVAALRAGFTRYWPVGAFVAIAIFVEMLLVVGTRYFGPDKFEAPARVAADAVPNTVALGRLLYTDYVYPFEIAAAILLVAMIAAMVLTLRPGRQTKCPKPEEQVNVHRADRVRLVKMPAEK